jgi:cell wall-associated NlpC family hydrolase
VTKTLKRTVALLAAGILAVSALVAIMPGTDSQAYTNKVWKKNVSDKYLNKYKHKCMPCTTYAHKVVNRKHYGMNLPLGTVASQQKYLDKAVNKGQIRKVTKYTSNVNYNNIKAGDIVVFKVGGIRTHIAIVGGNGMTLHHGGIGAAGSVQYKYTVGQFVHYGFRRLGFGTAKIKVYRALGYNKNRIRLSVSLNASDRTLAAKAGKTLLTSGSVFYVYKNGRRVGKISIGNSGVGYSRYLKSGTYTLKLVKAPAYMKTGKTKKVTLNLQNKKTKRVTFTIRADRAKLRELIAEAEKAKEAAASEKTDASGNSSQTSDSTEAETAA